MWHQNNQPDVLVPDGAELAEFLLGQQQQGLNNHPLERTNQEMSSLSLSGISPSSSSGSDLFARLQQQQQQQQQLHQHQSLSLSQHRHPTSSGLLLNRPSSQAAMLGGFSGSGVGMNRPSQQLQLQQRHQSQQQQQHQQQQQQQHRPLGGIRSVSLGSVNHHHQPTTSRGGMTNETFRLGPFLHRQGGAGGGGGGAGAGANPFLDPKLAQHGPANEPNQNPLLAAAAARGLPPILQFPRQQQQQQQQQRRRSSDASPRASPAGQATIGGGASLSPFSQPRRLAAARGHASSQSLQQHQQQHQAQPPSMMPSGHGTSGFRSLAVPVPAGGPVPQGQLPVAASGCLASTSSAPVSTICVDNEMTTTSPGTGGIGAPDPRGASPSLQAAPVAERPPQPVPTGPTELYRLVSNPPLCEDDDGVEEVDWDAILRRATTHPHEACFYDPGAGGHVYALHRLLRRGAGGPRDDDDDDDDDDDSMKSSRRQGSERPPVRVVEAVMRACPRAVTRKQAVLEDDDEDSASRGGSGGDANGMDWQGRGPRRAPNLLPDLLPDNRAPPGRGQVVPHNAGRPDEDDHGRPPRGGDHHEEEDPRDAAEEVRYEYPLAIACECAQDGEVVRLLASYLARAAPVYRSEVFRSLDYASLPNPVVRILLEEYAGCVLERGMNSEATEGDDDDCPLEQVLFWWDDPDMMGMEEDIADYPDCDMRSELQSLYEKLRMMLYAASAGTMAGYDASRDAFPVLHHVLRIVAAGGIGAVRFPNDFAHAVLLLAKFVQRERPAMFQERDGEGSLPIHAAVSGAGLLRERNDGAARAAEPEGVEVGVDRVDEGGGPVRGGDNIMEGVVREGPGDVQRQEGGEAQQANAGGPLPPQAPPGAAENRNEEADNDEDDDEEEEDDGDDNENVAEDASAHNPDMEVLRLLLELHPASVRLRDSKTGSLPVHLLLRRNPRAGGAISHLLELHPRATAMPDGEGRLPIHVALAARSPSWDRVVGLNPAALEVRDSITGLLPFQLAAACGRTGEGSEAGESAGADASGRNDPDEGGRELDSLTTTFLLLRMSPCLAAGLGGDPALAANGFGRPASASEQLVLAGYKPRVVRLEEENEALRRKVEELERELTLLRTNNGDELSGRPSLKKRKSSLCSSRGG